MKRPYTSKFFEELIDHITHNIRHVAIGVDLLVGFPGETERAFENTCRLIERLAVAYLHVFPFSPQAGTPAEAMVKGFTKNYIPVFVKGSGELLNQIVEVKIDRIEKGRVFAEP